MARSTAISSTMPSDGCGRSGTWEPAPHEQPHPPAGLPGAERHPVRRRAGHLGAVVVGTPDPADHAVEAQAGRRSSTRDCRGLQQPGHQGTQALPTSRPTRGPRSSRPTTPTGTPRWPRGPAISPHSPSPFVHHAVWLDQEQQDEQGGNHDDGRGENVPPGPLVGTFLIESIMT